MILGPTTTLSWNFIYLTLIFCNILTCFKLNVVIKAHFDLQQKRVFLLHNFKQKCNMNFVSVAD